MKLDDHVDKALADLPAWEPPAGFARRVAAAAQWEHRSVTLRPRGLFWVSAALQGVVLALVAYVGSSVISSAATSFALTLGMVLGGYARSLSGFTL